MAFIGCLPLASPSGLRIERLVVHGFCLAPVLAVEGGVRWVRLEAVGKFQGRSRIDVEQAEQFPKLISSHTFDWSAALPETNSQSP